MSDGKVSKAVALGSELAGPQWSEGERSEPERNGGPANSAANPGEGGVPDPEVVEQPKRRRFSAQYKAQIVREAEQCTEPGQIGALLRREGLYSSHLTKWRRQYRQAGGAALRDNKRGRQRVKGPLEVENERLRNQVACLQRRLEQAETVIEIQKKVSQLLAIPLNSAGHEGNK